MAKAFNLSLSKSARNASDNTVSAYVDDIKEVPTAGWRGWIGALVAGVVAALLRIPGLSMPHAVMFDETYYVKDGLSLINFGYEQGAVEGADATLLASGGHNYLGIFNGQPSYIVHPPLGKWIIGYGQEIFGATPFGWRFPMAILGILSVIMTARIVRRLTNSDLIGTVAGLLLALDGLHITMSRTALLDTPLSFFALAAFGFLILDRDFVRDRMRDGIIYKVRWYRWAMAFTLGLACATKWSGLYFAAAFGLLMLFWDYSLRKQFESEHETVAWLKKDVAPALLLPVVIVVTYLSSWIGWFRSTSAWDRQWGATNGSGILPSALRGLLHYHAEMLNFHTHLTTTHSYKANPWTWPLMIRPTSFFYGSDATCGAPTCSQEVVPLGNPLIWWGGVIALAFLGYLAVRRRNSAALPILVAFVAGWVPWLFFPKRTTFSFYSIAFIPYTVMACAIALFYINKAVLTSTEKSEAGEVTKYLKSYPDAAPAKRWFLTHWPIVVAVSAVALLTWYFYPLAVGHTMPYDVWHSKMWLKSWI